MNNRQATPKKKKKAKQKTNKQKRIKNYTKH